MPLDPVIPILPTYMDSTMMSAYRSCPRKFYLEFVLGLRPPGVSIDLHAGGCFASALESVYESVHSNQHPLSKALSFAEAQFQVAWGDFEIPSHKKTAKTRERMWEAVESYFDRYPPITDHVQPYFVNGKPTFEYTFAIPLEDPIFPLHPNGSPWIYCGRFDMLGTYNGMPVVRDEKTTGTTMSTGWAEKWDLRSQFLGYVWACQQMGIDLDQVCVRGISIMKTKIDHAEAIKTYSKTLVERWYQQLARDLHRMRKNWDEGYFDYNLGETCTSYGSCIFTTPCQSADPSNWYSQYVVRRWNPLTVDPTKEATVAGTNPTP